ncbi:MAG: IS200/IS605 family element transposase accessory protein TnpB [Moorea sp. SIOASIH]|uniref:RNA-guided endonuclease InsQ/TnpB family protein n=1 Tax=Moorena sp. SIOASIH TaxID=2607817 RepID=UPI0013B77E94|nr:RNA-guided endonuclease TnpB family protein [Moorena sp. SIOASIH]NEO38034.1 IS200/IS605 family element transposase accessory protein TnpB [Moorena sp. SIOASIH]
MLVYEFKLKGKQYQYNLLDEAIRTGQFIQNSCLRLWMDAKPEDKINRFALNKYCKVLADNNNFPWVKKLNSMARQAHAERTWSSISRFYDNCKKQIPGKKGFPKFKKNSRSVEYKTTGYQVSIDRKTIKFTDGFKAGTFKLVGSRDLHFYPLKSIKRVRVVKRVDGYYAQFCIDQERLENTNSTGKAIGLDVGIKEFYTDSNGGTCHNPKYLRKSENKLKRLQRKLSKCKKGSKNRKKFQKKLAKQHLKVSRQRKDFVVKTARALCQSNDLVAVEDLQVKNMIKNHKLAKSISDASWSMFRSWLEYFGKVFGRKVIAVKPHFTSQNCSSCGKIVKKSLSIRTHVCSCGCVLDRDENAAINILNRAGHAQINASGQINLCQLGENLTGKLAG